MIKAIIFDLDNCIFDTSSMGGRAILGVEEALFSSELSEEDKISIRKALSTDPLDDVLARFKVPADIGLLMREAYKNSDVPADCAVRTYGDEGVIANLPVIKILVTSGYKKFQTAKIERLGIGRLFDEIILDALDEPSQRKGKRKIFEEILGRYGLNKDEVLVVGDNPRSELAAAKELGIVAVQTVRPRIAAWDGADHRIASLDQLLELIK